MDMPADMPSAPIVTPPAGLENNDYINLEILNLQQTVERGHASGLSVVDKLNALYGKAQKGLCLTAESLAALHSMSDEAREHGELIRAMAQNLINLDETEPEKPDRSNGKGYFTREILSAERERIFLGRCRNLYDLCASAMTEGGLKPGDLAAAACRMSNDIKAIASNDPAAVGQDAVNYIGQLYCAVRDAGLKPDDVYFLRLLKALVNASAPGSPVRQKLYVLVEKNQKKPSFNGGKPMNGNHSDPHRAPIRTALAARNRQVNPSISP
jgi:hypothetical protein